MKHIKHICFYIIISIFILNIFPVNTYGINEKNEDKEVLVIYSDNENLSCINSILSTVNKYVKGYGMNINYHTENIPDLDIINNLDIDTYISYIEDKYNNKSYDAIITMGEDAFKFITEHKIESFNNIPVVISGVNSTEYKNSISDFSGVLTDVNFDTLIESIKTVQPNLSKIYFYGLDSVLSKSDISNINKSCRDKDITIVPISINDFKYYDFKMNKSSINSEALIVCDKNLNDSGNVLNNDEFFNYIRDVYSGPTYVYNANQLDVSKYALNDKTKFIGGLVFDTDLHGKIMYEKLLKIFTKTRTKNRDVNYVAGKFAVDKTVMEKYNFNVKLITSDFEIIENKEDTFDKILKKAPEIIVIICVVIILSILLFHYFRSKNKRLIFNLSQSEKRYEELLKLLPDPVIVVNNNKISYINDYGINYLKAKNVVGMNIDDIVYKEVTFNPLKGIHTTVKTEIILLDKEVRDVEISYTLDSNVSKGIIMVIRDLTDEKLLVKRKEFDKLRSEFFANISHELRTPINIILSTTQLLQLLCSDKGEKFTNYLESLKQNAYRLTRLTNNLIDSTKIDAGYMNLNLKPCNIVELTEEVTLSTINFAKEKGITVTFDTDEEEVYTMVDFEKYERIILNLLSNAIKYNRQDGTITVTMSTREKMVDIAIKDSGIGIPSNEISSVFERFVQTTGVSTSNVQGSGIGLSLVKSLVEMHKGRISVSSVEGEYTEFVVSMPLVEDMNLDEGIEHMDRNNFNANKMALVELSDLKK